MQWLGELGGTVQTKKVKVKKEKAKDWADTVWELVDMSHKFEHHQTFPKLGDL